MSSPLERIKDLKPEPPDAKEFAGLKSSAAVRLRDASVPGLSLESRFSLAYDAAHAYCLAALRYRGFRASNRYIVFQVLPHTLRLGPRRKPATMLVIERNIRLDRPDSPPDWRL